MTCAIELNKWPAPGVRAAFYSQLRAARALVLRDAEAYAEIVHVVERLGALLDGRIGDLGRYEISIAQIASGSPLANEVPAMWRQFHTPFTSQYKLVRQARNDAMHQGAFARHLAEHLVCMALTLEDSLMAKGHGEPIVADFMVRTVLSSELWQPVSYARQQMLVHAFSFLPLCDSDGQWHLLSDLGIARFLAVSEPERKRRLSMSIGVAVRDGRDRLKLDSVCFCYPKATLSEAIKLLGENNHPLLVRDVDVQRDSVIGIVSAFECL